VYRKITIQFNYLILSSFLERWYSSKKHYIILFYEYYRITSREATYLSRRNLVMVQGTMTLNPIFPPLLIPGSKVKIIEFLTLNFMDDSISKAYP